MWTSKPTAISLSPKSNGSSSLRDLYRLYESEIGNLVILDNLAPFYVIPCGLFALDGGLENYSYVFVTLHDVPVC